MAGREEDSEVNQFLDFNNKYVKSLSFIDNNSVENV